MDIVALIARARDHYVEQFEAFANAQSHNCTTGSPEVKLRLGDHSALFDRLCCVDFIKNDGKTEVIELQPDRVLSFEPVLGSFGAASVTIEHLRWDDIVIHHDATELPSSGVADWFQLWFDPDDKRHNPTSRLSGIIHSLLVQPGELDIDLGSAPPEAFWDMLTLIERAGAKAIRVTSSRAGGDATSG